mmetsp:Transcript_96143/g.299951  ORF Transcript_96143/g.299951 Transcript_96143/m.299951 type:complete len:282 (-) Transcript_96143:130-975(-)
MPIARQRALVRSGRARPRWQASVAERAAATVSCPLRPWRRAASAGAVPGEDVVAAPWAEPIPWHHGLRVAACASEATRAGVQHAACGGLALALKARCSLWVVATRGHHAVAAVHWVHARHARHAGHSRHARVHAVAAVGAVTWVLAVAAVACRHARRHAVPRVAGRELPLAPLRPRHALHRELATRTHGVLCAARWSLAPIWPLLAITRGSLRVAAAAAAGAAAAAIAAATATASATAPAAAPAAAPPAAYAAASAAASASFTLAFVALHCGPAGGVLVLR